MIASHEANGILQPELRLAWYRWLAIGFALMAMLMALPGGGQEYPRAYAGASNVYLPLVVRNPADGSPPAQRMVVFEAFMRAT